MRPKPFDPRPADDLFRARLSTQLEAKMAQERFILTESQLAALEKANADKREPGDDLPNRKAAATRW